MVFTTEKEFLDEVQKVLEKENCKVWREVIPDKCKKWELPWRVDMIIYRKDIGYIGMEGKNMRSISKGSITSEAIDQIKRYKEETYFEGKVISRWCLCIPPDPINNNRVLVFVRTFIKKRYDYDLLEYNEGSKWRDARVTIGLLSKNVIKFGGGNNYVKSI